jgi:hypothetical protein
LFQVIDTLYYIKTHWDFQTVVLQPRLVPGFSHALAQIQVDLLRGIQQIF